MEAVILTKEEAAKTYRSRLLKDFPRSEVRPLAMILRGMDAGEYICFGAVESDSLIGYAFFLRHGQNYLLDYLATVPERRNQGIGSAFLALLPQQLHDAASILTEVEAPDCAADEEERSLRRRRMDFYLRCGYRDTGVEVTTFGVRYRLLESGSKPAETKEEVQERYLAHYRATLPASLFHTMIRIS